MLAGAPVGADEALGDTDFDASYRARSSRGAALALLTQQLRERLLMLIAPHSQGPDCPGQRLIGGWMVTCNEVVLTGEALTLEIDLSQADHPKHLADMLEYAQLTALEVRAGQVCAPLLEEARRLGLLLPPETMLKLLEAPTRDPQRIEHLSRLARQRWDGRLEAPFAALLDGETSPETRYHALLALGAHGTPACLAAVASLIEAAITEELRQTARMTRDEIVERPGGEDAAGGLTLSQQDGAQGGLTINDEAAGKLTQIEESEHH